MRLALLLLLAAAGAGAPQPGVTPVRGPSWLQHLGVELDDTHMGKMGGEGPPPATRREPMPSIEDSEHLNAPFTLGGHDLYRLNCQSCHGPDGRGAPLEINSLLDVVRATSPALLEARQREQGRRLPPGMAQQLAADAEKTLRDRLGNGGKRMPAFRHLSADEVGALVSYLKVLAGVPGAELRSPPMVIQSATRVGEHLVKGTCHICHPATGPTPSHMDMYMRGVIPPLASIPEQLSTSAVLGKVLRGGMMGGRGMMRGGGMMGGRGMMRGGGMMGGGMMMGRMSRMPVLSYLTDEEVMAAYLFLSEYPPRPN